MSATVVSKNKAETVLSIDRLYVVNCRCVQGLEALKEKLDPLANEITADGWIRCSLQSGSESCRSHSL